MKPLEQISKIAISLTCLLSLAACDPIVGSLEVSEAFKLVSQDSNCVVGRGNCVQSKTVEVPAGVHSMQVKMHSENELVLTIKTSRSAITAYFKVGKNKQLPSYNGEFVLSSKDSGQPVDLWGALKTTERNSERSQGIESCTYERLERVCWRDKEKRRHVCEDRLVTYYGHQQVEYYYHYTDKFLKANINQAGSQTVVADYSGTSHDSDKIYTYKGICR